MLSVLIHLVLSSVIIFIDGNNEVFIIEHASIYEAFYRTYINNKVSIIKYTSIIQLSLSNIRRSLSKCHLLSSFTIEIFLLWNGVIHQPKVYPRKIFAERNRRRMKNSAENLIKNRSCEARFLISNHRANCKSSKANQIERSQASI